MWEGTEDGRMEGARMKGKKNSEGGRGAGKEGRKAGTKSTPLQPAFTSSHNSAPNRGYFPAHTHW